MSELAQAPEHTEFQKRYLEAVRGWHRYEIHRIGRDPSDAPVLDMDVAPPGGTKIYSHIKDVRADLEELAGDIPPDEPDRELVAMTAASNVMFLRAQAGEEFGFEDYVESTVGFRPGPVSEDEIAASAARVDEILSQGGLRYDPAHRRKFLERAIRDTDVIKQAVAKAMDQTRGRADSLLADPPELDLQPEYVSEDEFGVSAIYMDYGRKLHWTVNLIPERHPLDISRINTLTAHEVTGHGYHMMSLGRAIRQGRTNPVLGTAGMHMPAAFQTEALAQNAEFEFLDGSWQNLSRAVLNAHIMMVMYDASWRVNHGEDPQAVSDSIKSEGRLPFEPESFYGPELLEAMRDDPLYRAYLAAYYPAVKALEPLRSAAPEDRRRLVNGLYETAMSPRQIGEFVTSA